MNPAAQADCGVSTTVQLVMTPTELVMSPGQSLQLNCRVLTCRNQLVMSPGHKIHNAMNNLRNINVLLKI